MKPAGEKQHLLIDADDTLWENNIYFEEAFEQFVDFLDHSSMSAAEIRTVLDEIEIANIKIHGYGAANFARNLAQCYERLAEREIRQDDLRTAMSFAERILDCPMELIEGVVETLAYLSARHELTLFTKGHPEEQKLKIDRSGLGEYFQHTAIVKEKDTQAYATLARERALNTERTWMVGNSPKSDINPALAAGLKAVFIPHPRTWGLEHEEIQPVDGRLLVLETFADLQQHF
ncbi:MAG TPA: HAD family hydrolase [Bryobacteraceae bacterium]|nr:HAD family hydrolase [Bryobacteraceae bacterium]